MSAAAILLVIAIVLAVVAAIPIPSRVGLGWLAVACVAGALLLGRA